ncbi:hypothetical protein EV401DRAFT_1943964 [Pisolithus croceorrhizus]|nr:hypothetical protein EV401DRAFT_1943964 [Pisolithus croceorrhizus]
MTPALSKLEAEARRERDRSRREAEMILTREAEQRRAVEERVLAMMGTSPQSLPPPQRVRSQTLPNPPSPANSLPEAGAGASWWTAAKNRLTPTKEKEPLTPAQQIIKEVKARDKEKKITKGKDKGTSDLNLQLPPGSFQPRTSSPTSPSPNRTPVRLSPQPAAQPPVNLSPISLQRGTSPGGSPAREQPPLYASFTPSGTLDVPGTLLIIAKRFEKLERWAVSHVRALEERMGDVERWLVERENERGKDKEDGGEDTRSPGSGTNGLRDEVTEMQSRISELGREMARLANSPATLSNNNEPHEPEVIHASPFPESSPGTAQESFRAPSTSSVGAAILNVMSTPRRVPSLTARESTSPPLARVASHRTGTRLPYPTGDYASPEVVSPTHTPADSPSANSRPASAIISGLPPISSPLGTTMSTSPPARAMSPTSGLPAPSMQSIRYGSISPSPMPAGRKRYTVALGGPIVAPPEVEAEYEREREKVTVGLSSLSSTTESSEDDDEDMMETIGKKAASRALAAARLTSGKAQSTYGGPVTQSNQGAGKHRWRSQSTDFRSDSTLGSDSQVTQKFVDPLILRRQSKPEKTKGTKPLVGPGKKVPIGELVAFFDSERKN